MISLIYFELLRRNDGKPRLSIHKVKLPALKSTYHDNMRFPPKIGIFVRVGRLGFGRRRLRTYKFGRQNDAT